LINRLVVGNWSSKGSYFYNVKIRFDRFSVLLYLHLYIVKTAVASHDNLPDYCPYGAFASLLLLLISTKVSVFASRAGAAADGIAMDRRGAYAGLLAPPNSRQSSSANGATP
jgi:hypothetical protein